MGRHNLIDFAWARDAQDVLVDFVLLETSIRFNLFPRPINLEDHLFVDQALLLGHEVDISGRQFCSVEREEAYRRLAAVVQTVRGRAKNLLGQAFSMERYLLTQFIVLYGLLAYEQYEPYASTRALGMIAKRLCEAGRLSFCREK